MVDTMKFVIDIKEEYIKEVIATSVVNETKYKNEYEIKKAIEKGVKDLIYINKAEIIEKEIQRASAEMVNKGFKHFIDKENI